MENMSLEGGLYIIGTPIGNLGDITLRALEILKHLDVIACEDTRVTQKLLSHFGISKKLLAFHDHNEEKLLSKIMGLINGGQAVGVVSDAGMPLISDPGFKLVRACHTQRLRVTVVPGPSAVLSALCLSGFPTDQFVFCGFANPKKWLAWQGTPATLIFFEAPHRLVKTLGQMAKDFNNREVAVVREITKRFEEVIRGDFKTVMGHFDVNPAKGEIVILLSPGEKIAADPLELEAFIKRSLETKAVKETSQLAAEKFGLPRKDTYNLALKLRT